MRPCGQPAEEEPKRQSTETKGKAIEVASQHAAQICRKQNGPCEQAGAIEHRREELRAMIEEHTKVRKGGLIEDGRDLAKVSKELQKLIRER